MKALARPAGILASAFLLALSQPNPLLIRGLGPLAFIALIPLFLGLRRARPAPAVGLGVLYGSAYYALANYWLANWHPAGLIVVLLIQASCFAALFPVISVFMTRFPRGWPLWTAVAWTAFERLRAIGFLAYPYGFPAYALWEFPPALGLASLAGIQTLGFLLVLVNASAASLLSARRSDPGSEVPRPSRLLPLCALAASVLVLGMGAFAFIVKDKSVGTDTLKVALVQPASEKRQRGAEDYAAAVAKLLALSREALAGKPDLLVWHETAIVPAVDYHLRYRPDPSVYRVVRDAVEGMAALGVPVLHGTGRAVASPSDPAKRINYNAARLVLSDGSVAGGYDKVRLVPFAERFPFPGLFPRLKRFIESEIGSFWQAGSGANPIVFAGIPIATPICFEDSFPDLFADFAAKGTRLFIVLTDDSWSRSVSCSFQHLAMSAFRAAETGIPVARASATGITALLGPDGELLNELEPGIEGVLLVDAPLADLRPSPRPAALRGAMLGDASIAVCATALAFLALGGLVAKRRRPS